MQVLAIFLFHYNKYCTIQLQIFKRQLKCKLLFYIVKKKTHRNNINMFLDCIYIKHAVNCLGK